MIRELREIADVPEKEKKIQAEAEPDIKQQFCAQLRELHDLKHQLLVNILNRENRKFFQTD